jgi:hypothetical protein
MRAPNGDASSLTSSAASSSAKKPVTSADSQLSSKLTSRSELYGESSGATDLDAERLKEAIKRQEEQRRSGIEADDRKRKYNSMADASVTKEDMEVRWTAGQMRILGPWTSS